MKKIITYCAFLLLASTTYGQVGIGTNTPDGSSILDLNTTSKGLLIPRLTTTQVTGLTTPANGLMIFNTDLNTIQVNRGTSIAPDFQSLVSSNSENWLQDNEYIYAKNAYDKGTKIGIVDEGRMFIGNQGKNFSPKSDIKFVVNNSNFDPANAFGQDINVTNSLIMEDVVDFDNPTTFQQHVNVSGLVFTPKTDHAFVSANTNTFILKGKTGISGMMVNGLYASNMKSDDKLDNITNLFSVLNQWGTGKIGYATSISASINTFDGLIENAVGVNILGVIPQIGGSIDNAYGLLINNNIKGANKSYAIYNESGADNYFAGKIGINNDGPTSSVDIDGSLATAIEVTKVNMTLDETNHTVIVVGGTNATLANSLYITLPNANKCKGRIYIIVNNDANPINISSYTTFTGTVNYMGNNQSITIQSDGNDWFRIK